MLVLGVARNAFQANKNIFESRKVVAGNSDTAESFEEGGKQRAGFGTLLLGEGGKRGLAEVFGNLIGPQRFEKWSEFAKSRGNNAAGGGIGVFQATRVVQKNG